MRTISQAEYQLLTGSATVLTRDAFGDKVFLKTDGIIIKQFRRKKRLSSQLINPYAQRFKCNVDRLKQLDIITVEVQEVLDCPAEKRHLITYQRLPGNTLREMLQQKCDSESLLSALAVYIASLHNKGVYFRSLHFGNILVQGNNLFALIDVVDMRFRKRPLNPWMRGRNFRHMLRYRDDAKYLREYGIDRFMTRYFSAAKLPRLVREIIQWFLPSDLR